MSRPWTAPWAAVLLGAAAVSPVAAAGGDSVRIELVEDAGDTVVEARGLGAARIAELARQPPTAAGWAALFPVRTRAAEARPGDLPPLMGSYSLTADAVRFRPRFPLLAGESYVARWLEPGGEPVVAAFTLPRPAATPATVVSAVYPSATRVPENLLRLYVVFSAPMSRGEAARHIRLLDDAGSPVEGAFVAPERELWSPDRTRLTLFFDPGRIKRGVGPHAEVGSPLRRGRGYRLLVDGGMRDARGLPLLRGHAKELRAGAPDREQPSVEAWTLEPPAAPGEPVALTFPEPLDRGLLEGLLEVLDESGRSLAGRISVAEDETRWSFLPDRPWSAQVYRIRVAAQLEDLAGNSLLRPFETALAGGTPPEDAPRYVEIPFSQRR